jgi:hypothetical protein
MGGNMAERKYQHYVPQTYLKKWLDTSNQVHLYDKEDNLIKSCKTDRIMGKNDLYTKGIGYLVVCSNVEKKEIFKSLDGFDIFIENRLLRDENDFSLNYYLFDKWVIKDKNGNVRNKKSFQNDIEQVRVLTVEKLLSDIENRWNNLYESIIELVNSKNQKQSINKFTDNKMEEFKRFIFIQEWRTTDKIKMFKEAINESIGFMRNEMGEVYDEMINEFPKCFFLEKLQKFIRHIPEPIIDSQYNNFKMSYLKIFLTTGNKTFFTNDNPIIIVNNNLDNKKNIKQGLYYPISPSIVCGFFKGDNNKVSLEQMPVNTVRRLNKLIKTEANEFYISSKKKR